MIRDEERRLRSAIRSIVLVSGASALALYACSASRGAPAPADGGMTISNEAGEAGEAFDGSSDAGAALDAPGLDDASVDAADDGRVPMCDGGPAAPHPSIDGGAYLDAADEGGCDHF